MVAPASLQRVRSPRTRLPGVARVVALLAVLAAVLVVVSVFEVRSALAREAMRVGLALGGLEDLAGPGYELSLNGQRFEVASRTLEGPFERVAAELEQRCARSGSTEAFLSRNTGTEMVVACWVRAPDASPVATARRVAAWVTSQDPRALGELWYAHARRSHSGRVHLLTCRSRGGLRLDALLAPPPSPGEASLAPVPPAGSRLILRAALVDRPLEVLVYAAPGSAERVARAYQQRLVAAGWRGEPGAGGASIGGWYTRGDAQLVWASTQVDGEALLCLAGLERAGGASRTRFRTWEETGGRVQPMREAP